MTHPMAVAPSDHITISAVTLDEIEARILSGHATWIDCCQNVLIQFHGEWQTRTLCKKTLKQCFVRANRTPPKRSAGPRKPDNEEEILRVILMIREQMCVGICKMYEKLNHWYTRQNILHNQHTSRQLVEHIYLSQGWTKPEIKKVPRYRCRVNARFPNCLWRSDLHDCKDIPFKMMIIMDDCSRRIQGYKLIANKQSVTTADVLLTAISNYGPVAAFLTDNGGEFSGKFAAVLNALDIIELHTEPYNPQQNGKVERFWQTFERTCNTIDKVPGFIIAYNQMPHSGLPVYDGIHQCPDDVWSFKDHWWFDEEATWVVDGVEKPIRKPLE
jgi:hypothetical protein